MDDYISIEEIWEHGYNTAMAEITKGIKFIPAADIQFVVRCKDRKYRKEHRYEDDGEPPYIKYSCKFTKYSMSDEGFCSFGVESDGDKDNNVRKLTDEETAFYESWIESEAKDTGINIIDGGGDGEWKH